MKKFNLVIIGSGNIGSRHLQGLSKSKYKSIIHVIDPSLHSLEISRKRINNLNFTNKEIFFNRNMNDLPKIIDLAIISTTASFRGTILKDLISKFTVKNLILEKVVFQRPLEFSFFKKLFDKNSINVWVNCPRRLFPFYSEIKKQMRNDIINMEVLGFNWGLACNSLHFLDLFSFITNQSNFIFFENQIHKRIYSSKRSNFIELRGSFSAASRKGDKLKMTDSIKYKNRDIKIKIMTEDNTFEINEDKGELRQTSLTSIKQVHIPFQSEITGTIVDRILDSKNPFLVSFDECMNYHIPMLEFFNLHLSNIMNQEIEVCPIS